MILVGDVGGSKSEFALVESGRIVWKKTFGPANPKELGPERLYDVLREVLEEVGGVDGVVLGVAGTGRESGSLERGISRVLGCESVKVVSDSVVAYLGAFGGFERGVLILSGTGSVVLAFNGDDFVKFGGWGHILGDEGGGYRLSLEALRMYLEFVEKRIDRNEVVESVEGFFDLKGREDVIELVYRSEKRVVASFAKEFLKLAKRSSLARDILKRQVEKLLEPIPIAVKVGSGRISYSGGLFRSEVYRSTVEEVLSSMGFELSKPLSGPLEGAILLSKT